MSTEQPAFYTVADLAERYKLSMMTIYSWIKQGKIRPKRMPGRGGREYRIPIEEVQRFEQDMD